METVEFLRPRLLGARFEGGAIPFEVLNDLAGLEAMVVDVARWRFLADHLGRQRCPRGFGADIKLRLVQVQAGSAVLIVNLALARPFLPGVKAPIRVYVEEARSAIVGAIAAAERDQAISEHLPDHYLGYFDRIGRSLRDGESIEFATAAQSAAARLSKETRRKLLLASPRLQEFTEAVTLRGRVPEADQRALAFELQLADGRRLKGPIADQHLDTVIQAFDGYQDGARVQLHGVARCDREGRILRIESVDQISALDPLDIAARLDELDLLNDGWLEGSGLAPPRDGLEWFGAAYEDHVPDDLPSPHLYPTPAGGIQAEWTLGPDEISLDVDLAGRSAELHVLNTASRQDDATALDLNRDAGWHELISRLRGLAGDKTSR